MQIAQATRKALFGLLSPLTRRALRHGVGAAIEHHRVLGKPWRTVIDVGANRGQFALAAIQLTPGLSAVHSFEPLPRPAEIYRRVFAAERRAILHQCAVGARCETATMHVSARDDSSSLLPISRAQVQMFPGTEEVGSAQVDVHRLSDVLSKEEVAKPALLKIDVQGYELNVLAGSETLLPSIDAVYVECSLRHFYEGQPLLDEITFWLHSRDFIIVDIGDITRDRHGRAVQGDFLFMRKPQR